jgi:hypothetical protein
MIPIHSTGMLEPLINHYKHKDILPYIDKNLKKII